MSTEVYSYSLRWLFDDEQQHELSVKTLLKSEKALTDFIYDIAKQFDIPIEIKAVARKEGSLKSEFLLLLKSEKSPLWVKIILALLPILVAAFFQQVQSPKSTVLDREKFVIELQEKINSGTLTKEQAEIYVENFSSVEKYRTAFFKANKSDNEVSGIEVKEGNQVIATIPRQEFDKYISQSLPNEVVIPNAKIHIISPVLVAGNQEKWTGEYEKEKIRFTVKDKDFLEKSQTNVISFSTGFFIICELRKITKTVEGKEQITWEVLNVTHRAVDEEHIIEFEHTRKNTFKEIPGQMRLFE